MLGHEFVSWVVAAGIMGVGTAMVYPTLLAAVSDVAHPEWRGSAVGVYRLWRDGGYAVGALLSGVLADLLGLHWAIAAIAGVTALSGLIVARVMYETLPNRSRDPAHWAGVQLAQIESGAAPEHPSSKPR